MLPTPKKYQLFPGVVLAGQTTKMTILPCEKAFLFPENEEYTLKIIQGDADDSYYKPTSHASLSVAAHNGVLRFDYLFCGEQDYTFRLQNAEGTLLGQFSVYSLHEDLYELTPVKGDFHSHSYRSDGVVDPSAAVGHYREQGFDCFALTDHNRFYPGEEIEETSAGVDSEFFAIRGEEIHAPESTVHIVHIGGKESVTKRYTDDFDGFTRETDEYLTRVPKEIPAAYAERYAKAMWAADYAHKAGGIVIFPHPFWRPGATKLNNVCTELAAILLKSGIFDAYEVVGGMTQAENNQSIAFWNDLRAEGLKIPVVGSSDVHAYEKSVHFPHIFTLCFVKERSTAGVVEAIKGANTVAIEATGTEYERQYRAYGSHRLVTYAQFLLRTYYHESSRLAVGEGVALRAYAMGEADKELVELNAKLAREYRLRFFGRMEPKLPSKEMLDWEERRREIHKKSPDTKGSRMVRLPGTPGRQI